MKRMSIEVKSGPLSVPVMSALIFTLKPKAKLAMAHKNKPKAITMWLLTRSTT